MLEALLTDGLSVEVYFVEPSFSFAIATGKWEWGMWVVW